MLMMIIIIQLSMRRDKQKKKKSFDCQKSKKNNQKNHDTFVKVSLLSFFVCREEILLTFRDQFLICLETDRNRLCQISFSCFVVRVASLESEQNRTDRSTREEKRRTEEETITHRPNNNSN